ncbi:hypothetical protein VMUT_0055 [Vulcanisaeta moutnovskia 768-28]|uniref:Thioredoxin-like fold domain-containing protein n=3 Tax=Vulcanisaeta TaxID=164450 RepID=F0QYZ1_VULM7|nr:hypothetical protein [Vulcanisaeta moutnovskia]ADY00272.1 hypothetical protein VMUT_0055 [Vulcanisaeta moutnovskia 768-28]
MIINIRLYMIEDRDDKYLEIIKEVIKEATNELRLGKNAIRFVTIKISRDYLDIIISMLLGGEGPAEFMPIINELREYNVFDLPALIINGRKIIEGRRLSPTEVRHIILRKISELLHE